MIHFICIVNIYILNYYEINIYRINLNKNIWIFTLLNIYQYFLIVNILFSTSYDLTKLDKIYILVYIFIAIDIVFYFNIYTTYFKIVGGIYINFINIH